MERPRAVVVAVDPARLDLYARTLRIAQIPSRATLDLDEAAELLTTVQPSVLVLDHGLPRLYILRLYGMVRGPVEGPRVKVLFVGQDGVEGPDDYYLPGEPSPVPRASPPPGRPLRRSSSRPTHRFRGRQRSLRQPLRVPPGGVGHRYRPQGFLGRDVRPRVAQACSPPVRTSVDGRVFTVPIPARPSALSS